ncbi:MAG: hypothetical protein J07HN6_02020 [Halonotius sp. J07HN6]|nr:MAG: hypothetical protein J07HN6_02020 [Halonotius sp. J07HN6]ESS08706.1 MAG: hypothetical protein A07HN63_01617 [uncultured archaeon A07HN63]
MVREQLISALSDPRIRRVLLAVRTVTQSPSIALVLITLFLVILVMLYANLAWGTGLLLTIVMGLIFGLVYFLMTIVWGLVFYYKDNREIPRP